MLFIGLMLVIGVLVAVAFFTLLDRNVLGYVHLRKGPNKVGFSGILQPFSAARTLFCEGFVTGCSTASSLQL